MPAPRTTSDLERSLNERERRIVLNRRGPGRGSQEVVNISRAVQRRGEFVRGNAGRTSTARNSTGGTARGGVFGRIRNALNNFAARNRSTAAQNRGRARAARNRRG
jgi:hypothetical protein